MKSDKRAIRRHHRQRLRERRKYYFGGYMLEHEDEDTRNAAIGRTVTTPKPCSCSMCGNPRRFNGKWEDRLTLQERKANMDSIDEQLEDLQGSREGSD